MKKPTRHKAGWARRGTGTTLFIIGIIFIPRSGTTVFAPGAVIVIQILNFSFPLLDFTAMGATRVSCPWT